MSGARETPVARAVETAAAGLSLGLRLYALNVATARNLYQMITIPDIVAKSDAAARGGKGPPLIDVERDGRIGIDLKFGSITFKEETGGTYAVALVDVIVGAADMAPDSDTRVQMTARIAADPDRDSILEVTERLRSHIVTTLRAAAATLDEASARTLLFHQPDAT